MIVCKKGENYMVGIKDDYYKALYKDFNVSTKNKVKLIKRDELKEGEKLSIVSNTMFFLMKKD